MTDPNAYSGDKPPKRKLVELPYGQSAEPNQCGSCAYFNRLDGDMSGIPRGDYHKYNAGGYCGFKLPPHVATRFSEEGNPTNRCNDTHGCDLWKSTGFAYLVQHKVEP